MHLLASMWTSSGRGRGCSHTWPSLFSTPVSLTKCRAFLQHVSIACYAERCISYDRFCLTVRPSDRLSPCQNDSSYDDAVFTGG